MWDAMPRADLLAHRVAQAAGRRARQCEREPRGNLVFRPHVDVVGRRLGARQGVEQATDRLQRHHVRKRMLAIGKEPLNRVVERADARRQPQLHRRRQRQLRVVDHSLDHQPRVAHARLVARLVRKSRACRELRDRQRGGHGDVGKGALVMPGQPDRDDLGRIDHAAAAEADDCTHAGQSDVFGPGADLCHRRVLSDNHDGRRFEAETID